MQLKTLQDIDVSGKTILYRAPYDIGVTEKDGGLVVNDDSRIKGTLPTLQYLIEKNCKIVVLTWVKRPDGIDEKLRTIPHANRLSELLNRPVTHLSECVGDQITSHITQMKAQDIIMLENVRFHKEEYDADDAFSKSLTNGCDLIVFDGFPQSHREAASTTGILKHLPSVCGKYFESEFTSLNGLLDNPEHPFTLVIGGAKLSEKIDAIENLLKFADIVLIGGAVANVFLKSEGKDMANSYSEDVVVDEKNQSQKDMVHSAKNLNLAAEEVEGFKTTTDLPVESIFVPHDLVVGKSAEDDSDIQLKMAFEEYKPVPDGWGAYDIGPLTARMFSEIIMQSKTVFWAGPMGMYEKTNYSNGTSAIAKAISHTSAKTIVAGGDTIDALVKFGHPDKIDHISLAGGATLDFLGGKPLVVLEYLKK